MTHKRTFQSATRGLDYESFPMRLWQKAKTHGVWNPAEIDFRRDREDWRALSEAQQEHVLQLCGLFQAGEEAVTLDLLPLIQAVASEGRIEEEMYLTSFLFEEAKHVDLFRRFFNEVTGDPGDLSRYYNPSYEAMFCQVLPEALNRLQSDSSPEAQIEASVTYNMIIEGVLAETGYYLFHRMLTDHAIMPGMEGAVALLKRDESRHIAFGVYFLSRLIIENGDSGWLAFETKMAELQPLAEAQTREFMTFFEGGHPFGIPAEDVMSFSQQQFQRRLQRIHQSRSQTLDDLHRIGSVYDEEAEQVPA